MEVLGTPKTPSPRQGFSAVPMRPWQRPNESQECCGEASAERVDFDWSDHLNRAQRFTDGLPNKPPASQHRSETSQSEEDGRSNANGVGEFFFALLSAGSHLSCCDEPVVAQVAAWFQRCIESRHPINRALATLSCVRARDVASREQGTLKAVPFDP